MRAFPYVFCQYSPGNKYSPNGFTTNIFRTTKEKLPIYEAFNNGKREWKGGGVLRSKKYGIFDNKFVFQNIFLTWVLEWGKNNINLHN